ncbi:MAG: hypothetical protein ACOCTI_07875, partial [Phycisphaeraceae bacterium]
KMELCRRVDDYGLYEPFARRQFLAGHSRRLGLYLEIDHFRVAPAADDRFEVRLRLEVVLYSEADGLAVWRQDPVQYTDLSRSRRRDFFIARPIELPANLGVGKYRLKVRVTDLHGGSMDEHTIPLQLVADEKLTQPRAPQENRPLGE